MKLRTTSNETHMKPTKARLLQARRWLSLAATLLLLSKPTSVFGIAGLEGTFEFGLDAPWRLEPSKRQNGSIEYGAIPIQITIHDAMNARMDDVLYASEKLPLFPVAIPVSINLPSEVVSLGRIRSIRIKELGPVERNTLEFQLKSLHEIEMTTGSWPTPTSTAQPPVHKICRVWDGEDPEPFRDVSNTSEWHASMWYSPYTRTPGSYVSLQIEVVLERPPLPQVKTPHGLTVPVDVTSPLITLRNYVRVYLAPDPLPRFDNQWLYGDLHYHSQGTDNEGESGYNYRGVIRAMGSMGLDFLFAVDHASSSEQIMDADLPPVSKIPEIAHSQGDKLKEKDAKLTRGVLRDMDAQRYAFSHGLIYGANGANREASHTAYNHRLPQTYLSHQAVPQIFLGGEVDAIPELKVSTIDDFTPVGHVSLGFPYGNGLIYDLSTLCAPLGCTSPESQLLQRSGDSYLVHDFQSLESFQFFGRQHLLYFPSSSDLQVGNSTSFIPSRTSFFGGATRRLENDLLPEFERKGVVFVAHHLNGSGSRGPDGVPWTTDHMLLKAFKSSAVLGMEFWNEDSHYHTKICSHDFCRPDEGNGIFSGAEYGYERHEELKAHTGNPFLDLLLAIGSLPGIDYDALPQEFHQIALPLEEVRRGFISGGSKGGLFELNPFDVRTGQWQERSFEVEHSLRHGAYDWDKMNLRGLDFEHNTDLTWLKPGEPRRMFMGGGSDAHGDLNYRRAGYFLGTDDANDTAIGKPRNLVFAGAPEGPVLHHLSPVVFESTTLDTGSTTSTPTINSNLVSLIHSNVITAIQPNLVAAVHSNLVTTVRSNVLTRAQSDSLALVHSNSVASLGADVVRSTETTPVGQVVAPASPFGDIGKLPEFFETTDVRPHTQEQILRALRQGHFSVTDGPAIRTAIDKNGNNRIDPEDVQMGDIDSLQKPLLQLPNSEGQTISFITEVVSTVEFGPIMNIDLYVGVHPTPRVGRQAPVEPRMYSTLINGPQDFSDDHHGSQSSYQSDGRNYVHLKNDYWNGDFLDKLTWKQVPGDPLRYTNTFITKLHLDYYQVGKGITADRFFVRAFAHTAGNSLQDIPDRYAYSNPIWIVRHDALAPANDGGVIKALLSEGATISASKDGQGRVVITFTGTCQYSPALGAPFTDLPSAESPYVVPTDKKAGFFRAKK